MDVISDRPYAKGRFQALAVGVLPQRPVVFAGANGPVAGRGKQDGQRADAIEGLEVVEIVLVAVVAVGMVVQARKDDGSTGAAARRGRERVRKEPTILCERVQVRGLDDPIAVGAGVLTVIVGDENDDAARLILRRCWWAPKQRCEERHAERDAHG